MELKGVCLQASYTPEDHKGINLKEALSETLLSWKLDPTKQVALTTDGAANIRVACQLLGWFQLKCFSHNLDLAIQKGLADRRVERVIRICRQIVAAFSYSWKKRRELIEEQKRKLPEHKLKADVKTRWGSLYDMIERIVEQKEPIRVILGNNRKTAHLVLSWQDTDILDSIVAVLHPLREFTDLLAAEKRVTASAVLPLLNHITENVLVRKDGETDLTCEIKEQIKLDLTFRYSHEDIIHFFEICTFLDPQFKQAHFSDENCQNLESRVKQEMFDLYNDHNVSTSSTLIQTEDPPSSKKTEDSVG